jgi:hypothetical protein
MEGKKPMSHGIAGLLIAVGVIVVSMITMIAAQNAVKPGSGLLTYATIIAGLVFVIHVYAKAQHNYVTFGELFSYGFKATAVYTIVFVGFLLVYSFMFPEFKTNAIEATRVQMESGNTVGDQQIEQSVAILEKYFWVMAIGGTTLFFVIVGALGSLLGAAITKKIPQPPLDQSLT